MKHLELFKDGFDDTLIEKIQPENWPYIGYDMVTGEIVCTLVPEDNQIEYKMIDLGLPSGLKWADRNVGAETPQDNGLYFDWGNVEGHRVDENGNTIDGYSFDKDTYATTFGSQYTDSELDIEHDAATANMGREWRMPTIDEIRELVGYTDHYYIGEDGNTVDKSELTISKKLCSICFVKKDAKFDYDNRSNFIEIPFAGDCYSSSLINEGIFSCVWSSSVNDEDSASELKVDSGGGISHRHYRYRHSGISVRGVYAPPIEYKEVDLGLSVKWADRNVGAETPQDNGLYFSWGNVDGHAVDENSNTIDGYSFDSDIYVTTSGGQYTGSTLDAEHDAATVNMGSNWRMPTVDEINELVNNTDHYYIDLTGNIVLESQLNYSSKLRSICFVKQSEEFNYNNRSNFIEIPFAGYCNNSVLANDGWCGCVWSNSPTNYTSMMAIFLGFNNDGSFIAIHPDYGINSYFGLSVRGVVGANSECTIAKVEVMDSHGNYEELTEENYNDEHICSGPFPGCYHMVRIYGENLVVNNKYNFTFNGNSPWEGIEDPNNTAYWRSVIKDANMCELESLAQEDAGITPYYPFVIPGTSSEI